MQTHSYEVEIFVRNVEINCGALIVSYFLNIVKNYMKTQIIDFQNVINFIYQITGRNYILLYYIKILEYNSYKISRNKSLKYWIIDYFLHNV